MTPLQTAETTANVLAMVAAWAVWLATRRRASAFSSSSEGRKTEGGHLPVALLLTAGVVSAAANEGLTSLVPAARPIVDPTAILALHLDQARGLTWHLAAAIVIALAWRWRTAAGAVLASWPVILAAGWLAPLTERAHADLYAAASLAPVALAAWCVVVRNGGRWTVGQRVAVCVAAGELVALLTYVRNPFKGAAWSPAQAGYLVAFTASVVVMGGALWSGRRR